MTTGAYTLYAIDCRDAPRRNIRQLAVLVRCALDRLERHGFAKLVTDAFSRVIAFGGEVPALTSTTREFVGRFTGAAGKSGHLLASQLVYSATALHLIRQAAVAGRRLDQSELRAACWSEQKRFLGQFEGGDEWIAQLDPAGEAANPPWISGAA